MDRTFVYPGAIPADTDLLSVNRNTMIALGYLAQAVLGVNAVADGLACEPTAPPSMTVNVGAGSITMLSVVDTTSYGSLAAAAGVPLVKMGVNSGATPFVLASPVTPGQSINYLIQATLAETDIDPIVLPYYNAANPAAPFSGPANSGAAQSTIRTQTVNLQLKVGSPGSTGFQTAPLPDSGSVGLYVIAVDYGQTSVSGLAITVAPSAPFLRWKLPLLTPGFASGVQSFVASATFTVPMGVTQVEVELWGGGSGSFASVAGLPSGGGSGGGYARKRVTGLVSGQQIPVVVGQGGAAGGTAGVSAAAGGTSSFGSYVSATGGSLNYLATLTAPQNGATPAGVGVGGDANFKGSAGQAAILNQGGMGGAAPMGGAQNSGTTGVPGVFPGGGAAGAGTGATSSLPFDGAAGASGLVIVRW